MKLAMAENNAADGATASDPIPAALHGDVGGAVFHGAGAPCDIGHQTGCCVPPPPPLFVFFPILRPAMDLTVSGQVQQGLAVRCSKGAD